MFKNYLLVTFRNLLKNRVFTAINILGLGIALSVCIVAFFNHMFNYEFDRNNENFDKIYGLTVSGIWKEGRRNMVLFLQHLVLVIKRDIPGDRKSRQINENPDLRLRKG